MTEDKAVAGRKRRVGRPKVAARNKRSTMVSVRLRPAELQLLSRAARKRKMTVVEFVREAAIACADGATVAA